MTQTIKKEQFKKAVENASTEKILKITSNELKTATKTMECNASTWLQKRLSKETFDTFTEEEKAIVRKARMKRFMIVKGDKYIRQRGTYAGKAYVSKFIEEINAINDKYNLYSITKASKS